MTWPSLAVVRAHRGLAGRPMDLPRKDSDKHVAPNTTGADLVETPVSPSFSLAEPDQNPQLRARPSSTRFTRQCDEVVTPTRQHLNPPSGSKETPQA